MHGVSLRVPLGVHTDGRDEMIAQEELLGPRACVHGAWLRDGRARSANFIRGRQGVMHPQVRGVLEREILVLT